MKLVELLARKLKYWNETTDCYCQDSCGRVFPWIGRPEFDGSEWEGDSDGANVDREYAAKTVQSQLASDHATAIVTREMWQAERERIAKPGKKANAGGWVRHRGGKCPVEAGTLIDVRHRDGDIFLGEKAMEGAAERWGHSRSIADIMTYRIHKPAEQPFDPEKAEKDAVEAGAVITVEADIDFPSGVIHFDGPLQWRDRIREIDRTVDALEEERVSLIQRLEGEGLQLLQGRVCGSVQAAEDLSDWRNWRLGDRVVVIYEGMDGCNPGEMLTVDGIDKKDKDQPVGLLNDDGSHSWPIVSDGHFKTLRWHSRPST